MLTMTAIVMVMMIKMLVIMMMHTKIMVMITTILHLLDEKLLRINATHKHN